MNLNEFKTALNGLNQLQFVLPNGAFIPAHFHVTEVGAITRHFMDCGGTERIERKVNFQLWEAEDYDHRLAPEKLTKIIALSEEKLGLGNWEVEVEYQGDTVGRFGLDFDGQSFLMMNVQTDCLAKDKCGIPEAKPSIKMSALGTNTCTPGGGCC